MRSGYAIVPLLLIAISRAAEPGAIQFNRDVRPILSDKCFHCHGADAAAKKIPLRLDSEAAAKQVIAAGDPGNSLLIRRITAEKAAQRMPPPLGDSQMSWLVPNR